MAEVNLGPLAEEITTSLLNAIERHKGFERLLSDGRGALVVDPMIRYGGRLILALGDTGQFIRGELQQ